MYKNKDVNKMQTEDKLLGCIPIMYNHTTKHGL